MTILGLAIVVVIILVCLAWPAADPPKATEVGHVGPAEPGRESELATMDLPDGGSPELLGKLGISMPELPPQALSKACSLARHGASTDDLIRILKLTRRQAVTIVTNIRVR